MFYSAMIVQTKQIPDLPEVRSLSSILTLQADTLPDAIVAIEKELQKNPSRMPYYQKWVEGGRFIEIKFTRR